MVHADDVPPDYAERIRCLRGALGLTQADLGPHLAVSTSTVSRWEPGQLKSSQENQVAVNTDDDGGAPVVFSVDHHGPLSFIVKATLGSCVGTRNFNVVARYSVGGSAQTGS